MKSLLTTNYSIVYSKNGVGIRTGDYVQIGPRSSIFKVISIHNDRLTWSDGSISSFAVINNCTMTLVDPLEAKSSPNLHKSAQE